MRVNCEGCAGCCVDWRPVAPGSPDHERRGPRRPLDDAYNLVPLTRDEVRGFLDDGLGDALVPRLWHDDAGTATGSVTVDGVDLAALAGRPAFFVGLSTPPKPVAPFGLDRTWLRTCTFLDPETLQCRIHGDERYPAECADYPGHNLALGVETECERVEATHGDPGERLVDAEPPAGQRGLLLGPHAVGAKVFAYPDPDELTGVIHRLRRGEETPADRARFVAVAAASAPGTLAVDDARREAAREAALAADSWAGRAIDEWTAAAAGPGEPAGEAPTGDEVEVDRGAPRTPGWAAVRAASDAADPANADADAIGPGRQDGPAGGNG
jgi:hypothetical protein